MEIIPLEDQTQFRLFLLVSLILAVLTQAYLLTIGFVVVTLGLMKRSWASGENGPICELSSKFSSVFIDCRLMIALPDDDCLEGWKVYKEEKDVTW